MPTKRKLPAQSGLEQTKSHIGHAPQASSRRGDSPIPLPRGIRVLGKDISIDYATKDTTFEDAGQMCEETLSITIQPGQLPIEEMDTVLHETVHGLDYILDLGLSEHQVRMLATGLIGLFQDNPEFTAFVTRQIPRR